MATVAMREGFCTEAAQSLGPRLHKILVFKYEGGKGGEWYLAGAADCTAGQWCNLDVGAGGGRATAAGASATSGKWRRPSRYERASARKW